jgi:hypothetical protein
VSTETADTIIVYETEEYPDRTPRPPRCPGGNGACCNPDGLLLHRRLTVRHTASGDLVLPVARVFTQWVGGGDLQEDLRWETTAVVERDDRGRAVEATGLAACLGDHLKPARAWLRYDESAHLQG